MTPKPDKSEGQAFYERQRKSLSADQLITEKKMFGTTALCIRGKVFLFPWKQNLVFKLPESRVSEIVATPAAAAFRWRRLLGSSLRPNCSKRCSFVFVGVASGA